MTKIDLLKMLERYIRDYRLNANESIIRNCHMNDRSGMNILQNDIDALLVDFINYVGVKQCVDYAMYTSDLEKEMS